SQELAAKSVIRHFSSPDPTRRARKSQAVAFTADGGTVYAIDCKLNLTRMEIPAGQAEVSKLKLDSRVGVSLPATTIAIAPDASWTAWGNGDNRVGLAELPSGSVRFIDGHRAAVTALAFAPDGRALASADADGHLIYTRFDSGNKVESY